MTEQQRQEWRRAVAGLARQQRQQRHRPAARGLQTVTSPGMARVPPDRQAVITKLVRVAIATTPSLTAARRALESWRGHPADPQLRLDAIELLGRIEAEAKDVPATGGAAQEGTT